MAIPPETNVAFLREVDEELRRDQLVNFWVRWGRAIAVAIVVALAAFGGYLFWQHRSLEAAGREGEQLQAAFDALSTGKTADGQASLAELAQSKRDGYRVLARFTQADLLLQKNDLKGAAAGFAAIANDESVAQPFRDLALIRQTSAEYDQLKPQTVVERLRALAAPGNPWLGSAGELVAIAYLRMNRPDLAGRLLGQIARDERVPETIRQRAVQIASSIGDAPAPRQENTAR